MYRFLIDPDKWVNVGELELKEHNLYWFKKSNGQIVMGTPYSDESCKGIVDVCVDGIGLRIKTNHFHIVKGGQVQEVLSE